MPNLIIALVIYPMIVISVIILTGAILLSLLGAPYFNETWFRVGLLVVVLGYTWVLWRVIGRRNFKKRIEKEEYQESLREGGIEEARPFRELAADEKVFLTHFHKGSKRIVDNGWWIICLFLFIDIGIVIWILNSTDPEFTEKVIGRIAAFALFFQLILAAVAAKEIKFYQDLRSPVFKVQGRAIKEIYNSLGGKRDNRYWITVRKIKFSHENYPDMLDFMKTIKDGEEIAVEYSPHTKHIWKMYKTADI